MKSRGGCRGKRRYGKETYHQVDKGRGLCKDRSPTAAGTGSVHRAAQLVDLNRHATASHAPEREQDTAAAERVLERSTGRVQARAKRRGNQTGSTAKKKSSRLQFTDEERGNAELEKYIRKSDKAADRLDAAKAAKRNL